MTSEFTRVEIPMSMFSDDELSGLLVALTIWHQQGFEALAILTNAMVQSEGERRQHNRTHPESIEDAGYGCIRPSDWSDRDIAQSLLLCWGFSEHTRNPKLGESVDALGNVFVAIAAERLQASGDPRNATGFEQRNIPQQEGSTDAGAETN